MEDIINKIVKMLGGFTPFEHNKLSRANLDLLVELNHAIKNVDDLEGAITKVKGDCIEYEKTLNTTLKKLVVNLAEIDKLKKSQKVTDLDKYLNKQGNKIKNKAYKEKRYFKGKPISIYLNELIQRDSYEVLKLKKLINPLGDNINRARVIGSKVSRLFTWTDDKKLIKSGDYYVQPNESIVYKKVDCEDHAFVNASLDEEIGVVYGFMTIGNNTFGHAWNCFVHKGKLYYMETTGNSVNNILASKADNYDGRFIVTKDSTYQIGKPVAFGKIAERL